MLLSIFKRKRLIHSAGHTNQTIVQGMGIVLKRKILAAILSSLLFALIISEFDSLDAIIAFYYLNIMFAITYGVITSSVSDWVSKQIFKKTSTREIASFVFHCGFGLALMVLGLISAITFFIIDRLLRKVQIEWLAVIMAFIIVVLVLLIIMNL